MLRNPSARLSGVNSAARLATSFVSMARARIGRANTVTIAIAGRTLSFILVCYRSRVSMECDEVALAPFQSSVKLAFDGRTLRRALTDSDLLFEARERTQKKEPRRISAS